MALTKPMRGMIRFSKGSRVVMQHSEISLLGVRQTGSQVDAAVQGPGVLVVAAVAHGAAQPPLPLAELPGQVTGSERAWRPGSERDQEPDAVADAAFRGTDLLLG